MRYIDYAVIGNQFTDRYPAQNIIHLSAKGSSLGSHYVTGSLVHYLANQYGFENVGIWMQKLGKESTIIYVDDILEANDDDLLNPGILIMLGADAANSILPNWKIIFTKCIECKG